MSARNPTISDHVRRFKIMGDNATVIVSVSLGELRRALHNERVIGRLKGALRINAMRHAPPGDHSIHAEVDRIIAECEEPCS